MRCSYVSLNWRGKPLESLQVIIDLIGSTTTSTGLRVYARLDPGTYERGVKVTDEALAAVNPSTSNATRSTATGTTPSTPRPTRPTN